MKWDICSHLHAMTDFGFASGEAEAQGRTYSRSHTNNAECYAEQDGKPCNRRGQCITAFADDRRQINSKSWPEKHS